VGRGLCRHVNAPVNLQINAQIGSGSGLSPQRSGWGEVSERVRRTDFVWRQTRPRFSTRRTARQNNRKYSVLPPRTKYERASVVSLCVRAPCPRRARCRCDPSHVTRMIDVVELSVGLLADDRQLHGHGPHVPRGARLLIDRAARWSSTLPRVRLGSGAITEVRCVLWQLCNIYRGG
jgi:hypothetical protein